MLACANAKEKLPVLQLVLLLLRLALLLPLLLPVHRAHIRSSLCIAIQIIRGEDESGGGRRNHEQEEEEDDDDEEKEPWGRAWCREGVREPGEEEEPGSGRMGGN